MTPSDLPATPPDDSPADSATLISIDLTWFGLHERLRTPSLEQALADAGFVEGTHFRWEKAPLREELAPLVAAHLARAFQQVTASLRDTPEGVKAWEAALGELSRGLRGGGDAGPASVAAPAAARSTWHALRDELPSLPFRQLLEVRPRAAGVVGLGQTPRPDLPLGVSALLTGSSRTPSLVSQIEKELASADRVDWLVSFIKWSGVRALKDALMRFVESDPAGWDVASGSSGAPGPAGATGPRLRIATTSYLGATDLKAIEFLANLPGTEVRVSYDTHRTRLHAKAFLFHRRTGFGSGYVGSANVSRAALDEGLEWTAKISEHELPWLWRQLEASFASHWEDEEEFERVRPDDLDRLGAALAAEGRGGAGGLAMGWDEGGAGALPFFDLRPYGFQSEILEAIEAERREGIWRHLVIAATGTGKTMVAAFDYKRFAKVVQDVPEPDGTTPPRPTLLFLAHREEILKQSLHSFRQVLKARDFGDLLVGGAQPTQYRHLFASVQSWQSRGLDAMAPDHFDYVVLDEAHHAAANTYQAILAHVRPKVLLGLTATPERADGLDIRKDFGSDDPELAGRFTHELRLPDAIERRLLAPFHYFGVSDAPGVDFTNLNWRAGGYAASELDGVLGANDARAQWVRDQLVDLVADPMRVRGLGFCVSQNHARFMARRFTEWGIPSAALTADSPPEERNRVQGDLVHRRVRFIFTVDLYNEGVDIPEVDTVLLLRPTESLTVYLQQLGRGLRLHEDKPHLTVLDFIAPQHRNFRFADRFRALTRSVSERIDKQVEEGFPWLPSGCLIHLDRQARQVVLDNLRETVGLRRPKVVQQLAQLRQRTDADGQARPTLQQMLDWLHLDDPDDLLRHGLPCRLQEAAGAPRLCAEVAPYEKGLERGMRALALSDDRAVLEAMRTGLAGDAGGAVPGADGRVGRVRLALAHSVLWGKERPGAGTLEDVHAFVVGAPGLREDLREVVEMRLQGLRSLAAPEAVRGAGVLQLHAQYTREQILLALGKGSFAAPYTHREGVLHVAERKVDAFFVTIRKTEARFSPTTMYEDYATSEGIFHWQSQSTTSAASPTGRRYIEHRKRGYTPLLFVRESHRLENGLTAPFWFLGPLQYMRHEGDRPMSMTWRLERPMPARVYRWAKEVA